MRPTDLDRAYVRYCLRYAVFILGKSGVIKYVNSLDDKGNERVESDTTDQAQS